MAAEAEAPLTPDQEDEVDELVSDFANFDAAVIRAAFDKWTAAQKSGQSEEPAAGPAGPPAGPGY